MIPLGSARLGAGQRKSDTAAAQRTCGGRALGRAVRCARRFGRMVSFDLCPS